MALEYRERPDDTILQVLFEELQEAGSISPELTFDDDGMKEWLEERWEEQEERARRASPQRIA